MRLRSAIVTAVTLRVVLACAAWLRRGAAAFLAPDSTDYLTLATNLATRGAFVDQLGRPELQRTPGYPLLLAAGVRMGHPIAFALALNLLLSIALVALIYTAARRLLGDERAAAICAMAAAIEPTMMLWSLKVMPETLFTLLVLGFIAAARHPDVLAAVSLAAAAYLKPIGYPLILVAAILLRRRALPFLLICAALVAPWHARNYVRTGYPGFSTMYDRALYLSVGGSITARHEHERFVDVRGRMYDRAMQQGEDERTRYSAMRRNGLALLASDPLAYAAIHAQGMARTIFDPGAVEYLRLLGLYPEYGGALTRAIDAGLLRGTLDFARRAPLAFWSSVVLGLLLLPYLVMPLIAAARLPREARGTFIFLAVIVAYFIVVSGGVPGSSRFRAPAMPLLILMGGFAVTLRSWRFSRSPSPSSPPLS